MEATVAALLLVTASVVLACVVIGYTVNLAQTTMSSNDFAQNLTPLQSYINNMLNQTNSALDVALEPTPIPEIP
jgi:hypothetical protein